MLYNIQDSLEHDSSDSEDEIQDIDNQKASSSSLTLTTETKADDMYINHKSTLETL